MVRQTRLPGSSVGIRKVRLGNHGRVDKQARGSVSSRFRSAVSHTVVRTTQVSMVRRVLRVPAIVMVALGLVTGNAGATPLAPIYAPPARMGITEVTGLPLPGDVTFKRVDTSELVAILGPRMTEDMERLRIDLYSQLMADLGFVPPSSNLKDTVLGFLEEQSGGFYVPEEKTFYVVEGGLMQNLQAFSEAVVVAHELVHAAQDQARDTTVLLHAVERDDDRSRAISLAYEGQATLVGNRVGSAIAFFPLLGPLALVTGDPSSLLTISPPVRRLMSLGASMGKSSKLPRYIRDDFLARYTDGTQFAWHVERAWGADAHRWLVCNPPQSSEQILHPEKYLLGEDPPLDVEVALPDAGDVQTHTNLGEWGIYWLLQQHLPEQVAREAAKGWGGDRAARFANGTTVWRLVMDSEQDAQQLHDALFRIHSLNTPVVTLRHGREVHVVVGLSPPQARAASEFLRHRWVGPFGPLPPPPPGSICWHKPR